MTLCLIMTFFMSYYDLSLWPSCSLPRQPSPQQMQQRPAGPASPGTVEAIARDLEGDGDQDTMKSLRKTFAGIFGDM